MRPFTSLVKGLLLACLSSALPIPGMSSPSHVLEFGVRLTQVTETNVETTAGPLVSTLKRDGAFNRRLSLDVEAREVAEVLVSTLKDREVDGALISTLKREEVADALFSTLREREVEDALVKALKDREVKDALVSTL